MTDRNIMNCRFISAGEAAARLNVGVVTVYMWIAQGRLDGIQIGDTFYIPDYELKREDNND